MASLQQLCQQRPELSFNEYWAANSEVELYHFIGKDIVYFHALFWPALLYGAQYRTPTAVFVHGFLTVKGQKMSKSRGTFINARQYLNHLNPEYLRYYFATKLGAGIDDIDINFDDFMQRVNSDLVGKVVNIASRCAGFIQKLSAGKLAATLPEPQLYEKFVAGGAQIAEYYENRQYQFAVREIMALADMANQYIDEQKPWSLAKQPDSEAKVQSVCTQGLNLFYVLIIYLQPIVPELAKQAALFLNVEDLSWSQRLQPLLDRKIQPFKPLLQRITPESITQMLTENPLENVS
jgi:methionyl-tRNA synthetase